MTDDQIKDSRRYILMRELDAFGVPELPKRALSSYYSTPTPFPDKSKRISIEESLEYIKFMLKNGTDAEILRHPRLGRASLSHLREVFPRPH